MAEAIISGILDSGLDAEVSVGEPVAARRDALSTHAGLNVTASNEEAIAGAEIVVLAVKPQHFENVAESLSGVLQEEQTVLSIMAGVKMHSIGLKLDHRRLIRVMSTMASSMGTVMKPPLGVGLPVWRKLARPKRMSPV